MEGCIDGFREKMEKKESFDSTPFDPLTAERRSTHVQRKIGEMGEPRTGGGSVRTISKSESSERPSRFAPFPIPSVKRERFRSMASAVRIVRGQAEKNPEVNFRNAKVLLSSFLSPRNSF